MKKGLICKVIALAVLASMSIGVFSGCFKEKIPKVNMNPNFGNKPELSVLFPITDMTNAKLNDNYNVSLLEDITGYQINYSQMRTGNEENEAQTSISHRDQNNLMKLGPGSFEALVSQDLLLDLTEVLDVFGANIKAAIPEDWWATVTYNGKIYGIPETSFAPMQDNALVFNRAHIAALGKYPSGWLPETRDELTTLLAELKAHFGTSGASDYKGSDYRVFGLSGSMPDCNTISSTFGVPYDFYENSAGKVASMIYHSAFQDYTLYMNGLYSSGYMRTEWSTLQGAVVSRDFALEKYSVIYAPYWNMKSIMQQMVANNDSYATEADAKANLGWQTRLESSDGVKRYRGGMGNAYVLAIPFYMAENAAYVIDWINSKLEESNLVKFLIGEENVTYELTDASDPDAVAITYNSDKLSHGTKYYKLLPAYKDVEANSMYMTGNVAAIGKAFWPLREKSYDVWEIAVDLDDTLIQNVMSKRTLILEWAPYQISSKSNIYTYWQNAISASTSGNLTAQYFIDTLRSTFTTQYWTAAVDAKVDAWWQSTKQ